MTDIKYTLDDKEFKLSVLGHAGDSRVCAGVSVLAQVLLQNLFEEDSGIRYSISSGAISLTLQRPSEKAKILIKATLTGFEWLKVSYPNCVALSGFENTR